MKKSLALLLLCTLASAAFPQPAVPAFIAKPTASPAEETTTAEADGPEKIIARFFAQLQKKEVDVAYDQLTRGTKIAERAEDLRTLKSKTKEAITVFGPMLGYDSVVTKKVGTRLVSYTLLSLGKEFPLRWRFYFYKPMDAWKLIDIRVDDRLAAMFDETDDGRPREERP